MESRKKIDFPPKDTKKDDDPTAIKLAFERAEERKGDVARAEAEKVFAPTSAKEEPFDPHSVASTHSVEGQKQAKKMREHLAKDGVIPQESIPDLDVDIDAAKNPFLEDENRREIIQRDMDELAGSVEAESVPILTHRDPLFALYDEFEGGIPPMDVWNSYNLLTTDEERESFVAKQREVERVKREQVGVEEAPKEERRSNRLADIMPDYPRAHISFDLAKHLSPELGAESVVAEETPKDQRNRLRELVGRFTKNAVEKLSMSERGEKLKNYFATRSGELNEKAKEYGPGIGGFIRLAGEKYNAMSMKKKIMLGFGMGAGAAIFSGVSTPLTLLFGTGLAAQRIAGNLGMFCKIEKSLKKLEEKHFGGVEEKNWERTSVAALSALLYTLIASEAIGGAVHLASESAAGEVVHQWLRSHYPFGEAVVSVAATDTGAVEATNAATPAPVVEASAPEAPAPVVQEVPQSAAAAVETHAAPVHHEAVVAKVVVAPESAPVPVDTSIESPITEGQNVRIEDDIRQRALASVASLDQAAPAEAATPVATTEVSAATPEMSAATAPAEAPAVAQPLESIQTQTIPTVEAIDTYESTPQSMTQPLPEAIVSPEQQGFAADSSGNAMLDTEGQPVRTGSFEPAPGTNAFGIEVKADVPHVYADEGGKHLFVFGGSPAERAKSIFEYLTQNPDKVVFAADDSGTYRIPWHMLEGKVTPGAPMRTSGFFGFFSDFMKAPEPNELAKIIK